MRLPVNQARLLSGSLAALVLLAGAALAKDRVPLAPATPANGPASDYPVVVGAPFTIGNMVWTPIDQLNYDAVGQADVGNTSFAGVSAAHKTLPLPSYVEVTSLDSGRTTLVRVERRGPMLNDVLIELSPQAATQLGIAPGARSSVRVRRVNPPEQERAVLRAGGRASERIATPEGLLKVLRRKLADQSPLLPPPSTPPAMPAAVAVDGTLATAAVVKASAPPAAKPAPAAPPAAKVAAARPAAPLPKKSAPPVKEAASPAAKATPRGSYVVQVGTFSSEANARGLAAKLGGQVSRSGKFWRVRIGPSANRGEATAVLEKAKRAGYTDARIQSAD